MAEKTEAIASSQKLKLVRGLMGVMAAGTFSILDRRVDTFRVILTNVALVAETTHVLDGIELMFSGLLMADSALANGSWSMHILGFSNLVVTTCRDT